MALIHLNMILLRKLIPLEVPHNQNIIYLRDSDFVAQSKSSKK